VADKQLSVLARRVKQLRETAGLSQQALATRAGLSISAVFQIEQGSKNDPRVSTVKALADALGVAVDDLLTERPSAPETSGEVFQRKGNTRRKRKE
jgi:transcriptional regulator with XRE-family HTH domain